MSCDRPILFLLEPNEQMNECRPIAPSLTQAYYRSNPLPLTTACSIVVMNHRSIREQTPRVVHANLCTNITEPMSAPSSLPLPAWLLLAWPLPAWLTASRCYWLQSCELESVSFSRLFRFVRLLDLSAITLFFLCLTWSVIR